MYKSIALAEASDLQAILNRDFVQAADQELFAPDARYPLFVDGYDDDWRHITSSPIRFDTLVCRNRRSKYHLSQTAAAYI